MLLTTFMMLRWTVQAGAVDDDDEMIALNFTDGNIVEYKVSNKAVSDAEFLSARKSFRSHGGTDAVTENSTVTMDCSSQAFNMIDKLINEENIENCKKIFGEHTLDVVCEFLGVLDYLQYNYEVREIIHKRLVEHIFPRIVFFVTNEEQRSAYIECSDEYIKNQIKLILPLYLQRYKLGVRKEADMTVIYKDAENKNQKEMLESIEFNGLRIHPGALNSDIREEVNTDENQRLGVLLWMFDIYFGVSTLDLSGHTLTNGLMGQLIVMEHLKTLSLSEWSVKLGNDCDWIGTGFKALEDLDINGVKIEDVFTGILCRTTSLKKLSMEKCFIKPESNLEFIRELKDLEELRIGRNYLSEEHLNIICNHENIEVLDMDCCTVDDMYIYGGKIESIEMLKVLNSRKMVIKEGEMRIILLETDDEYCLENWKMYNERLMFFGDDGEIEIKPLTNEIDETGFYALESGTKTWRLSELNGSQVFVEGDREIRIVLPQTSSILEGLKESMLGEVYFTGKENGKMNFLDVMKGKGFMKRVKEYNCGQVYFADKQIDMILSHKGLKKLNMRQCGLESKAIMKIKDKSILMELDLSDNNMIGENDMIHIIKECPNLMKLNMNKCRMIVTGDFEGILALEKLEELNIGGNKLNCKCIKHITKHKKLLKLNLEGCGLVEDDLKGIEELEGLKELYIGDNFIGRRDLDRIFKLKELEVLNMSKIRLFSEEYNREVNINGIKALSKLMVLDLVNNKLHKENINEIFELKELRDLKIENYWTRYGTLRNISNLINLEKLSIKDFEIDKNDMEGITSLKNLKELNISGSYIYGERAFDNIGKLNDSLKLISIEKCYVHKEECMKKLVELTNLRELRLVTIMPFEILCNILEKLTCLRVLYLGNVNAKEFISCKRFPLLSLSKLEILDLECIDLSSEFIKGLRNLVNLRELSLARIAENRNDEIGYLDVSVFPSGLRKLKVSGGCNYSLDLDYKGNRASNEIFENLEELRFFNIRNISKVITSEIMECTKLRRFELMTDFFSSCKHDFKWIERIITLEELVLEGVYLYGEDIVRLSRLKQLRILKLRHCGLNEKYLNEIEELGSLEILDIKNNWSSHYYYSMNGILKLKNLRKLNADNIRFDYDRQGDFELIKGFESLGCSECKVYKNNECINDASTDFDVVVAGIRKEATPNNWKGIIELKDWYPPENSVIYDAFSNLCSF